MKKNIWLIVGIILGVIIMTIITSKPAKNKTIQTSSGEVLSNKKIGWGIKRNDNHEQPDLGSTNKKLIDENGDIAMGNAEDKYVYLTFDEGYEARIYRTNTRHPKSK